MHRKLLRLVLPTVTLVGCAGLTTEPGLPVGWQALAAEPPPFAALYRLECCARRNLLLTLRCDGAVADVAVTAAPGATLLRAWVERSGGWLLDGKAQCVAPLPESGLPVGEGRVLPLRPQALAVLMSGGLPPGSVPMAAAGDRVIARLAGERWVSRIAGPQPHVIEAALTGPDGRTSLEARMTEHRLDRIPSVLELRVGDERIRLTLVSWRRAEELAAPDWLAGARCREGS